MSKRGKFYEGISVLRQEITVAVAAASGRMAWKCPEEVTCELDLNGGEEDVTLGKPREELSRAKEWHVLWPDVGKSLACLKHGEADE